MKLTRQDKVFVALGLLSLLPILFIVIPPIVRTQNALTQADNTLMEVDKLSENTKVKVADIQEVRTTDKPEPESDKINVTAQDNQLLLIERRLQELDKRIEELDGKEQLLRMDALNAQTESYKRSMSGESGDWDNNIRLADIKAELANQILSIKQEKVQIAAEKLNLVQERSTVMNEKAQQPQASQETSVSSSTPKPTDLDRATATAQDCFAENSGRDQRVCIPYLVDMEEAAKRDAIRR